MGSFAQPQPAGVDGDEAGAVDRTAGSGKAFLAGLGQYAGEALNEFDLAQDTGITVSPGDDPALSGLPLDELDRVG